MAETVPDSSGPRSGAQFSRSILGLKKFKWLAQRLARMEHVEVLERISDAGRSLFLKGFGSRSWTGVGDGTASAIPLEKLRRLDISIDRLDSREAVLKEAEKWLIHDVSFFRHLRVNLGEAIDWHLDYSSGHRAPLRYCGRINHRRSSLVGNIKFIWELNRLQQLVVLALAWRWTRRDCFLEEIECQLLSWIDQNPFMTGVNWKSPLELGIRLISLGLTCVVCKSAIWDRRDLAPRLGRMVYEHQLVIRYLYSKQSSANNHLIGEMAGLYVASTLWPIFRESAEWRRWSKAMLTAELSKQVGNDGVSKELCSEYQLFVLELFILAGRLGELTDDEFGDSYWKRIESMAEFIDCIVDGAGNMPLLGDGDGGQAFQLGDGLKERIDGIRAALAIADSDLEEPPLRAVLLNWGQTSPSKRKPRGRRCCAAGLRLFRDGGYAVFRCEAEDKRAIKVVYDVGAMGMGPLFAHAHADALSFWLSFCDKDFLIDPGTFVYHGNENWRSYFRGTSAHNTIRIDGNDQSESAGTFMWAQPANCKVTEVYDDPAVSAVTALHDGYRRLSDPVTHRRTLRLEKKCSELQVQDLIECLGEHEVEFILHFSEACQVERLAQTTFLVRNEGDAITIQLDRRFEKVNLHLGSEAPPFGWISREFGRKVPCPTLVGSCRIKGSTGFEATIVPATGH